MESELSLGVFTDFGSYLFALFDLGWLGRASLDECVYSGQYEAFAFNVEAACVLFFLCLLEALLL